MDKKSAIKNLKEIQTYFPKGFLAYGTALGAFREKDIISHDLDTDFGVFSEDFDWKGITALIQKGFRILSIFGMRHYGLEVSLGRDGIKTDIMILYRNQYCNIVFNCLWDNGGRNGMSDEIRHEYDTDIFKNMLIGELQGEKFNTFGEPYIKAVYGKDWKTPKTPWNWRTDHFCNIKNKK